MSPSRPPEPERAGAEPDDRAVRADPPVACPHCGSTDVEVEAAFGSQLMTAQYWCRACRTVFERLKVEADEAPGSWLA
jgi:DNA-directed RNA polymerase subunit RPC12/RpoP